MTSKKTMFYEEFPKWRLDQTVALRNIKLNNKPHVLSVNQGIVMVKRGEIGGLFDGETVLIAIPFADTKESRKDRKHLAELIGEECMNETELVDKALNENIANPDGFIDFVNSTERLFSENELQEIMDALGQNKSEGTDKLGGIIRHIFEKQ